MLIRLISRAVVGLIAVLAIGIALDVATFDRTAAQQDYMRIKQVMAQNYANLDWQVEHRGLDLAALDQQTMQNLDAAYGRVQAYFAFRDFVAAFADPHLKLERGDAPEGIVQGSLSSLVAGGSGSCGSNGYESEDLSGDLDFATLPDWQDIESDSFPAGMSGDLAVLRIAEFGEQRYMVACEAAYRQGLAGRELQLAVRAYLQDELRRLLTAFADAGARQLVIDVTGNGGGTERSTSAAALFVDGELVRMRPRLPDPECDRSFIWHGVDVCPIFSAIPEEQAIEGEGAWTGPIVLLVDRNTGSATEEFAVWLRDNDRALLIGERTAGAGCGYMSGGVAVQLKSLPLHLMMPNCARFTRDGINEIEGLVPDIALDWSDEVAVWLALASL